MEKLSAILTSNPLATLLVAAVLIILFMFLFKDTIKKYLVKKFDLYDENQMKDYAEYHKNTKKFVGSSDSTFKNWKTVNYKKIMKARAVLLMFLISLISYTGFAYHTDPRQNSDVDDIVCISADSITMSGVVSVNLDLHNTNCSYVHSPTKMDEIMIIIGTKKFNQVTFCDYPVTDTGKEIRPYLFKPLATIRAVNLEDNCFKIYDYQVAYIGKGIKPYLFKPLATIRAVNYINIMSYEKRCNCWLDKLTKNPRDGLSTEKML